MTSNVYTQSYTDGTSRQLRRQEKQGRKSLPAELVKVKIEGMVLRATKNHAVAMAKKYNISLSAYIDLAVSLFDISKFSS